MASCSVEEGDGIEWCIFHVLAGGCLYSCCRSPGGQRWPATSLVGSKELGCGGSRRDWRLASQRRLMTALAHKGVLS